MPKFPSRIFVSFDPSADPESKEREDLLAFHSEAEAIDDDGPTTVAEYQLVKTRRLEKIVNEVPK